MITLLSIGSVKTTYFKEGCEEYIKRLRGSVSIEEVAASKQKDSPKQQEEECERVLKKIEGHNGPVWVLDERGENETSQKLAKRIEDLSDRGEHLLLVLGGAYGLNDAVRQKANRVISFGRQTFPHELMRLVVLEQLYRLQEIHRGSGYHH